MEAQKIVDFLDTYGILVEKNEPDHYVELMMDDHKCVEFNEERYYIPENWGYESEEAEVFDYLEEYHLF